MQETEDRALIALSRREHEMLQALADGLTMLLLQLACRARELEQHRVVSSC